MSGKNKWKEFCFQQNGCETCKYCDNSDCELEFWKDWARADERAKAERDFQNSDYWNDYLSKVIDDARKDERSKIIEVLDNADDLENAMYLLCKYLITERLKE